MSAMLAEQKSSLLQSAPGWRNLPQRIKALYITTPARMGGWLA